MQVLPVSDVPYYLLRFLLSIILLIFLISGNVMANNLDEQWLTRNIYHESRGQGVVSMFAVALVTINRVESPDFPNTIKGVVTQPNQFSWYNPKKIKAIKKNDQYYLCSVISRTSLKLWKSKKVKTFVIHTGLNKVKWFHERKVRPKWSKKKNQIVQIGNHRFYRAI